MSGQGRHSSVNRYNQGHAATSGEHHQAMRILSIYPLPGVSYTHDANACFMSEDGSMYAAEEERFLRSQHSIGHFPERAAMMALRGNGRGAGQIDQLVTTSIERCRRREDYATRLRFTREQLVIGPSVPALCVPHHLAHSALAVLTSPFDECIFLTLDGGGDGRMGHWGIARNNRFQILEQCDLSPALFFSYLTNLCGFPLFEEGKVMGLAAYGQVNQRLQEWFRRHFRVASRGASLECDLAIRWTNSIDIDRIDPDSFARHRYARWKLDLVGEEDCGWMSEIVTADVARTGQAFFEDVLVEIVENLTRQTGLAKVACAGGVFHNVAATGHLRRQFPQYALHIPVAPHDAGLSMGAALWARHIFGLPRPAAPFDPYIGSSFPPAEVERTLRTIGVAYERPDDFEGEVARLIAEGNIVGWFVGRAEYGARALGARSILADPRQLGVKARLNQVLKRRDWFMPFAPSILEEYGHDYFEDFQPSPYMNAAFRVRRDRIEGIESIVHADGTCRAHSVSATLHRPYHALLSHFHRLTGLPLVLNTSFNRHGVPMVATPRHALQHLLEGCVDILAIEGFVVRGRPREASEESLPERALLEQMAVRQAGRLAKAGRLDGARSVLARVSVVMQVGPWGLADEDTVVWRCSDSLEDLDRWWRTRWRLRD
jgi:carbamoyltransferase